MYKYLKVNFFILSISLIFANTGMADVSARKIMQGVVDRDNGDRYIADVRMVLIDKMGHKKTRILKVFEMDKGRDVYKRVVVMEPKELKGMGFLMHDYYESDKKDMQYLYLPETKQVKLIESADVKTSFMGSDLSYGDLLQFTPDH